MNNCYKLKPANYKPVEDYEIIEAFAVPCYVYYEGNEHEEYWVDFQNMCFYVFEKIENNLVGGKKYWIISPFKPKGTKIEKSNSNLVKWFVEWASDEHDEGFEWDFKNHNIIKG